jgi:pimeloyl-ACP methyl ester carboxylesterase
MRIRKWTRRLRKLIIVSSVLAMLGGGLLWAHWKTDPISFRIRVFQPVRELRLFVLEVRPFFNRGDIRKQKLNPDETVVLEPDEAEGIRIAADIWVPERATPGPALLVLHGSSPWGRKAALPGMLGVIYREKDWTVMVPDARGFGDTDDPQNPDDPLAWNVVDDVWRSLRYLAGRKNVDPGRIYVLGHSLGAGYAIESAMTHPLAAGLILIGPPRYIADEQDYSTHWHRVRFSADRGLLEIADERTVLGMVRTGDIKWYAKRALSHDGHKPVLLIDGARESEAELQFLEALSAKIGPPFRYRTVPGAGHYFGVRSWLGSDTAYVRQSTFHSLIEVLDEFLTELERNETSNNSKLL